MIVAPYNFQLIATNYVNSWYVYGITLGERLRYIGVAEARSLMVLPDATNNPYVRDAMKPYPVVTVTVFAGARSQQEARATAATLISAHRPDLNQYGMATRAKKKRVVCVETGEQFDSIQAAADFMGVHLTTMSNHLHRRRGYQHVRSKTFEFYLHGASRAPQTGATTGREQ